MNTTTIRRVAVAAGMAVAFTVGAGLAATAQTGGSNAPGAPTFCVGAASPTETSFVPIVPCRIFSTAAAGGKFTAGQTRSVNKGGNLALQGGNPAGCPIPDAATALEVNITAASAEGNGYIRVWPDESVEQGSTFMNFTNSFNVSNAGTVDVDKGSIDVMDLRVFLNRTHVIIDVLGYYVDGLMAVVNPNGTLVRGNGVATTTREAAGTYRVNFERNISGCEWEGGLHDAGVFFGTQGEVNLALNGSSPNGLCVQTRNTAGTLTDSEFMVSVSC
jgi:hypothetical protein